MAVGSVQLCCPCSLCKDSQVIECLCTYQLLGVEKLRRQCTSAVKDNDPKK